MKEEIEKSKQNIQVRSKVAWKEGATSKNAEMVGFMLGATLNKDNSVIGGITVAAKIGPEGQKLGLSIPPPSMQKNLISSRLIP